MWTYLLGATVLFRLRGAVSALALPFALKDSVTEHETRITESPMRCS